MHYKNHVWFPKTFQETVLKRIMFLWKVSVLTFCAMERFMDVNGSPWSHQCQ